MEIDTVSVDMSQPSVPEPPPAQEQPAPPVDTVASAQTITDPNLGQSVNILD